MKPSVRQLAAAFILSVVAGQAVSLLIGASGPAPSGTGYYQSVNGVNPGVVVGGQVGQVATFCDAGSNDAAPCSLWLSQIDSGSSSGGGTGSSPTCLFTSSVGPFGPGATYATDGGPSITLTSTGTSATVWISGFNVITTSSNQTIYTSVSVSGATTIAGSDHNGTILQGNSGTFPPTPNVTAGLTINPGVNTYSLSFYMGVGSAGTATYQYLRFCVEAP